MKRLMTISILVLIALSALAYADRPDEAQGIPNIGDRVIFLTDHDGDGFFEKSPAFVVDGVNTVARLDGRAEPQPGQILNLYVTESDDAARARGGLPTPFYSFGAHRGRFNGGYEALTTSNRD